jgi:hypothetical protein
MNRTCDYYSHTPILLGFVVVTAAAPAAPAVGMSPAGGLRRHEDLALSLYIHRRGGSCHCKYNIWDAKAEGSMHAQERRCADSRLQHNQRLQSTMTAAEVAHLVHQL